MSKSSVTFSVLLPSSLVADAPDLRQKTVKVGSVGRALAIFGVDKVCIYNDDDPYTKNQTIEAKLITSLLRYMETPQYLRKLLFSRTKELRYAGLLPPLRTPHHPLDGEKIKLGDLREAVVTQSGESGSLVEMGLREKGIIRKRLRSGCRLTVKLGKRLGDGRVEVSQVSREDVKEYWGYKVLTANSLREGLNRLDIDYKIGTSRRGRNLYEAVRGIKESSPKSVGVAFGGPYAGLFEICRRQGVDIEELFDAVVNTIPGQRTATVRTEEALMATLSVLNALTGR